MNRRFTASHEEISALRADMNRQFAESREDAIRRFAEAREETNALRADTNHRFERLEYRNQRLDDRMDRHFLWLLGVQVTVLITVMAALISVVVAR
ncbi:MAG: hypothetical protein HY657_10825 [Acidobacteria bacterium]|nr:hypothetical protein [Acidobacteriota bacterium]